MPEEAAKPATTLVKPVKRRQQPDIYRKPPEEALKDMFKEYLGPKSEIIRALQSMKSVTTDNKKVATSISENNTRLSSVAKSLDQLAGSLKQTKKNAKTDKNAAVDKLSGAISIQLRTNAKQIQTLTTSLNKMRQLFLKESKDAADRELAREADEYEQKLREGTKVGTADNYGYTSHLYQLSPLERGLGHLFGKGFNFSTGLLSDFIVKKVLNSNNEMYQQNKVEEDQSPQYKSYLRTKEQLISLLKIFTGGNLKSQTSLTEDITPSKDSTSPITKELDDVETAIKTGDDKIVKSINDMHDTLKSMHEEFESQTDLMQEDKTAAKLRNSKLDAQKAAAAFSAPLQQAGANGTGSSLFGLADDVIGVAGRGLASAARTVAKGAKRVAPIIVGGSKNLAKGALNLAKKPVGLAAGTGIIGGAAVGSALLMDKYSKEMMDAEVAETTAEAALQMQRNKIRRNNPEAYKLIEIDEKIRSLNALLENTPDENIPKVKKHIEDLFKERTRMLEENAKKASTVEPPASDSKQLGPPISKIGSKLNSDIAKVPITTGGSVSGTEDKLGAGLVTELRTGKVPELLEDIRDGIQGIQSVIGNSPGGFKMLSVPSSGPTVDIGSRSSIGAQRDALRTGN